MKTHDGSRDFECDLCGCRFTTNGSLKRHMIVHSDERYCKLEETNILMLGRVRVFCIGRGCVTGD
jgi:uncharacterized Zn-finger protein